MHPLLDAELTAHRAISRTEHPELATRIDWALRRGEIVRVHPHVYARAGDATSFETQIRAIALSDPGCVITGLAAGVFHGWCVADDCRRIEVASTRIRSSELVRARRRTIPARFIHRFGRLRATSRAMTAVELIPELGANIISEALRARVDIEQMWEAMACLPRSADNAFRRQVLTDSASRPWSAAERMAHRVLLNADVTRWVSNFDLRDQNGRCQAIIDIAFLDLLLGFEIDGREHHDSAEARRRDLQRNLRAARLGWQLEHVSAALVHHDPAGFLALVREICEARAALLGVDWPVP